jgi:hypothetical protein
MSFLYRNAITITRKQPYIDWANSLDDGGPELTAELAADRRTIYLVPEANRHPDLRQLLDEFWEDIFDEELAVWMIDEGHWPKPRTREMFDLWFDAEATDSILDLVPEEPLTQADADLADLEYAVRHCAWCDIEIDEGAGRFVGFGLADRDRFADHEGRVLSLAIDEERMMHGIMPLATSEYAQAGEDVVFRACTARCEKALRKAVPKALRKIRPS